MSTEKTITIAEAVRNLIVCDSQFGWTGETTLKLPELLDLQARGWLIEGDENNEFSLTVEGEAVVVQALQLAAPAELAEQQGVSLPPLPRTYYNACGDGSEPLYTAEQMEDYARDALAATGKQQVGEPEIEFQARLMDVKTDLPTENWRHSPTYDENPGRGTHYWVQFRKRYIYYTPPAQGIDLGAGVKAIAAERERQLQAEVFTRDGDGQYRRGELAKAATAYVQLAAMDLEAGTRDHIAWHGPAAVWPWAREWWKPVDARRDLVRAGALIAAQIDLIDSQAVGNGQ